MESPERRGSTRIMTAVEPGVIAARYTRKWSAFDRGSSPQEIPGLDAARCACAVKSFELAQQAGVPTHFVRQADEVTIHVREFAVPGREPLSGKVHGRVLPAEWIWRVRAYGSLLERLRSGAIAPEELGFAPGTMVAEGALLPRPIHECTTKFESVDRHLTRSETRKLIGVDTRQWVDIWSMVMTAVDASNAWYEKSGFTCPDGKCEVGWPLTLVDVFGTQDENRILSAAGELYSKDLIRNYLNTLPWKKLLNEAKAQWPADKSRWPAYPTLPDSLVELVSKRYAEVALKYANVRVAV